MSKLTKFTFPGLDVWLDVLDIAYMEREIRPDTLLILGNEKEYFTKLALNNGRVIACTETPSYILGLIEEAEKERGYLSALNSLKPADANQS